MELRKETVKQIRGLIVFTALLIVCLWKYDVVMDAFRFVLNILYPFLLGVAIAFVLSVPMNFVERKLFTERKLPKKYKRKYARGISLLIILSGVIGLLAIIMFGLIPQLAGTFASLGKSIQDFIPQLQEWADHWFHNNKEIMNVVNNLEFDWNKVMEAAMEFLKNGAGSMLESTINTAKNIIGAVGTFFIAFVFAMYILLQKEKLGRQAKKVLFAFVRKGRAEAALEVLALTYKTFSSFLTGQCVEALILGSMFVIAMTLLRLPYALLTGIVIAFTALIPIFGAFIGCAVGAFLIFMVSPVQALIFIVLFLVLQQIEGNLIYPHVVGNSVGLPSIWVLAAVSIGGSLMGIVGMLIFIPLMSVFYALFREVVYIKLRQKKIYPQDIG
ncbi:pheromone autoinducer 2 transporter [Dorea longicatena]|uniref:Pheromone autoinducer 2 transporter n=1 Tax=Dorea longicatena TaxID=88431 RepID=A0A564U8V8_9FIRM|nr:AI-2E family transporter [Dorea longicatena]VUX15994.1 pheromone autoinducer 2 transporter [Dorea longicatena]